VRRCRKADVSEKHFARPWRRAFFLGEDIPATGQADLEEVMHEIRSTIGKCRPAFGQTAFRRCRFATALC